MAKKRQDDGSEVEAEDNDALPKAGAETESTKENAMAKPAAPSEADLVKVCKGDETLEVHPDTLEAHVKAGWTTV